MKSLCTLATVATLTVAANAASVVTSFGPANNQAGPMFGQSITVNVGADTADGSITSNVFLNSLTLTRTGSVNGSNTTDTAFIHVYDAFTVDGSNTPTAIGNLVAVSTTSVDFTTINPSDSMTWNFSGTDSIAKDAELFYVFATDQVAATTGNSSNLTTQGLELSTGNPYTGGQAVRANGTTTDWDAEFTLNTTTVPEPSSTALLGLGGLALILRRRK